MTKTEERNALLSAWNKNETAVRERCERDTERFRKGLFCLAVTDEEGAPVPGVKIRAEQKDHEFRFGANLFMLDCMETPEKNETYKTVFRETFNMATLPFYWNDQEPEEGKPRYAADSPVIYRRPPVDLCLDFCEKWGIEPREHALAYFGHFPEWVKNRPIAEVKYLLEKRYAELSERYARRIPTIEVTNEMFWKRFYRGTDGMSELYRSRDFIPYCFKLAEKYFPNNKLVINESTYQIYRFGDYGFCNQYFLIAENAILKGARIDAIGLQYHQFCRREDRVEKMQYPMDPVNLFRVYDTFSALGRPLQITEVTVPAYSNEPEDEALQAEILEKLYRLWFSIPAMEQIVYWNVPDGYAAWCELGDMTSGENYYHGGLLRFDLSPKPALEALQRLIKKEWHTSVERETARDGAAAFTGFYGNYDLVLEKDGKVQRETLPLLKNGPLTRTIVWKKGE